MEKISLSTTGFYRWEELIQRKFTQRRNGFLCPQRSRPLHGLGPDGGAALRLLHLRSVLQRGGAGLPHGRLPGQNRAASSLVSQVTSILTSSYLCVW